MKIAFLGNFGVDHSSESHYLKTFRKLGHEVLPLQEGKTDLANQFHNILLGGYDMFFWVHTHGWETPMLKELIPDLKSKGIPIVGYHLDLWLGIERQKDLENDNYWKAMDYFFCTDKLMVDWLNERKDQGYPKAFFLPAGVFEDECYLGTPREEYKYDVIFVGSKGYHPEWPYRPKLVNWLAETYGNRFAHFGGDGKGVVRGKDLNDLYASAKVVVGDTLCKNFDYPFYLSDRIFETTGRGGFLIFPYIRGTEDLFDIKEQRISPGPNFEYINIELPEVVTYRFNNFVDLRDKIDYWLANDTLRGLVQKQGFDKTRISHTYTNRLQTLLNILQDERNKNT